MNHHYLIDTHAILWAVDNPSRLSRNATMAIRQGVRLVSVASFWEAIIKSRNNVLDIGDPITWWDRVVDTLDATVVSIKPHHVAVLAHLPDHHRDPFDRIMIAQAISEGYTFISRDSEIKQYHVKTLW